MKFDCQNDVKLYSNLQGIESEFKLTISTGAIKKYLSESAYFRYTGQLKRSSKVNYGCVKHTKD